jgi:nucleoside-diphosphate-sugar epimerase
VRVFLAGGSGVIGLRIIPLLVAEGHEVAALTRTPEKATALRALGAEPVVCDVYEAATLRREVARFGAQTVMHQLTDLPDDAARIPEFGAANGRIRREGTRNLIAAAQAAGVARFVAQSVAWTIPGDGGLAVSDLERAVAEIGGLVLRYGQLYGPGTYFEDTKPPHPRVQIDDAARRSVAALMTTESGVVSIVESRLPQDRATA